MELFLTQVTKNNIPYGFPGIRFYKYFKLSCAAKKEFDSNIFQVKICFYIKEVESESILFEYETTSTSKPFTKPQQEKDLFIECFRFITTAIDEFNRYIKSNKSTLTLNIFYPYPPLSENLIHAIRTAFINVENDRFAPPNSFN
jgi:hypothetical protein